MFDSHAWYDVGALSRAANGEGNKALDGWHGFLCEEGGQIWGLVTPREGWTVYRPSQFPGCRADVLASGPEFGEEGKAKVDAFFDSLRGA